MKALRILIGTLSAMTVHDQPLMPAELPLLRRVTGQIVSLAQSEGQDRLAEAGIKLCALLAAFARSGRPQRTAVRAHVRALRLLARRRPISEDRIGQVMAELDRALVRFGAMAPPDGLPPTGQ